MQREMHRVLIFELNDIKLYAKNEQINLCFHWMVRYAKNWVVGKQMKMIAANKIIFCMDCRCEAATYQMGMKTLLILNYWCNFALFVVNRIEVTWPASNPNVLLGGICINHYTNVLLKRWWYQTSAFASTAHIGFAKIHNYISRLEAKIIFDGKVNSRLFPILMRIIVSSAFSALRAVKLITKSSLSAGSKYVRFVSKPTAHTISVIPRWLTFLIV